MAFLGKPKDQEQYGRLMGMISPEATPSKRIGTEAPTGAAAAGPAAGKSAAEFTQTSKASPGSIFARQLQGADISGISALAEKPLIREGEQVSGQMKEAASQYGQARDAELKEQPQFDFSKSDLADKIAAGGEEFGTALNIMGRKEIPVAKFDAGEVKEFTPMQALKGGSVESLLRKEATGPYSTGMAGLDALLFAKKGGGAELAQRGLNLRADKQAEGAALGQSATQQAESKAAEFVKSQKENLEKAVKGGLTAREKAYTEAPEGQKSKLQEAQEKLAGQYGAEFSRVAAQRQSVIDKQINEVKNQALENTINKLRQESIAAQERAGQGRRGDVTIKLPSRAELAAQAENDPRYQAAVRNIELNVPYAQKTAQMQVGDVQNLGLENVISEEDAAQYNRLQQLIGGKAITPTAGAFKGPTYNAAELQQFFANLRNFSNV
jgi:hypothetical protein